MNCPRCNNTLEKVKTEYGLRSDGDFGFYDSFSGDSGSDSSGGD